MPQNKVPKSKMGFFGVRAKPSGHFGVEFSDAGRRFWLGTYPIVHTGMRAYDMAVWHAGRPKTDLNFPEIETRADADMLEHPEYAQAELEFFWKCDAEQKKKEVKKEDEASLSTVILVESKSKDWGDSEKEDEGCDDPDKDEFWEQFKSSDEE
ncbi:uncharacterized protein [Aegilops tauschii subsp. strangulata]|uniref:uncharacterized protein n=1 Tax=Aegilops tauschii subsp. strangulata TaxID=200361 RepID=UPI00098B1D15|nr:ethylene-responsive transcription factor 5-like [Aegilops tauschii subsp. strangulata]